MNRIGRRFESGQRCAYVSRRDACKRFPRGRPWTSKSPFASLLLIAIVAAVRYGLYSALDAFGFWPYMVLCGGLTTFIIAAAFAWDWHETRSRR